MAACRLKRRMGSKWHVTHTLEFFDLGFPFSYLIGNQSTVQNKKIVHKYLFLLTLEYKKIFKK